MRSTIVVALLCFFSVIAVDAGAAPPTAQVNIVGPLPVPVLGNVTVVNPQPLPVTGNVNVSRTPYQVTGSFLPGSCTFNGFLHFCPLSLAAVPEGKRLVIEHVSLFVAQDAGGSPDSLRFLDQFNGTVFFVQPTFTPRVNTPNHSFLDRPVLVYYEAGDTPNILLQLTTALSSAQMTVQGYMIDATE